LLFYVSGITYNESVDLASSIKISLLFAYLTFQNQIYIAIMF